MAVAEGAGVEEVVAEEEAAFLAVAAARAAVVQAAVGELYRAINHFMTRSPTNRT